MKNIIRIGSLLGLAFIIVNCSNPSSGNTSDANADVQEVLSSAMDIATGSILVTPQDTIPVDTLKAWVDNWRDNGEAWMETDSLKYFNMPLIDLEQLLGEADVDSARFYLGMEMKNGSYEPKLVLVGVDSSGKKMLNAAKGQHAYDLTRACPPHCKD